MELLFLVYITTGTSAGNSVTISSSSTASQGDVRVQTSAAAAAGGSFFWNCP